MKCPLKCCILILGIAIVAIALRLPHLAQRPMHVDEAVHAEKFGALLEKNVYRYDPDEYHGPTLNYFTLIPAWLTGTKNLTEVNEFTLRIVPVFFGIMMLPLLLFFYEGLGKRAIFLAATLTSISPAFVFYSRYYIQETLLVCFTLGLIGCGYRLFRTGKIRWAVLAGVFLGLMHATKETCIIAIGSILLATTLTILFERLRKKDCSFGATVKPYHWIVIAASTFAVSALFFSSFFTNPRGIIDSFAAYDTYFNRAGQNAAHIHPWYYYLQMLLYWRSADGPVWSEAFIVILAAVGAIVSLTEKSADPADFKLGRFLLFYTVSMTVIYAAIPYKTPWCLLGFLSGMILLAGIGTAAIWDISKNLSLRIVIAAILTAGAIHLTWQAYLTDYKFFADPRNPYVYAHTTTDIFKIADTIKDIARATGEGDNLHIEVICPGNDYWPLPWYLRDFANAGFYEEVDFSTPAAPVIIVSPAAEERLIKKLYELPPPGERELYVPLFDSDVQLRPNVPLNGYVRKSVWDRYTQQAVK